MAVLVLLRGANLGNKRFSPKAVESKLADLGVTSIGAAGTFVVRKKAAESTVRKRVAAALPFECDILIVAEPDVRAAVTAGEGIELGDAVRRFATALASPVTNAKLPIEAPPGKSWGVRVLAVHGRFALGIRKRVDETGVYPNEVVEKAFGVRATTRDWPTMEKIVVLFDKD